MGRRRERVLRRGALSAYLAPAFALVLAAIVLGEPITAAAVGGLGLIVAGVVLASRADIRPATGDTPGTPPRGERTTCSAPSPSGRSSQGSFDDFRREWEPRPWPDQLTRVLVSRNEQDPDQVLTASFIDIPPDRLEAMRDDPALLGAEDDRLARIADYEEALVYKGVFEVVEEITAPGVI